MSEQSATTEQAASTEHETDGISLGRVGLYATLVGLVGFYLIPIESGLVTSIKTSTALQETFPFLPPLSANGITFEKWQVAFEYLAPGMVNSMLFTIPSTILCAIFGSMAAYGLTLVNWRGQIAVLALFIAGIFVPYQAVIVPLFQFWSQYMQLGARLSFLWGLPLLEPHHATILELIITHTAYGIPIVTLLFRSQYKTMSDEMIEAARLDGASVWRVYRRIVLPLSIPMFAVVFIFQFTQIWNEFLFSLTIIGSINNPAASATLILSGLGQSLEGTDYPLRMAGAFITALPTLFIYVLFADKFAEGVQT